MKASKLRTWEAALMAALALTLLLGGRASAEQEALAQQVLRLHVVANSDSGEDQAVKLQVRDAVLAQAMPLLDGVESSRSAWQVLEPHLEQLEETARLTLEAAGFPGRVRAELTEQWFPTRIYDGFSLPPGHYPALKVVIGEGEGQNWWCVLFPPLCMASVTEEVEEAAALAGLSEDQVALITGRDGSYVLKFRVVEWWQQLRRTLESRFPRN